MNEQCFIRFDRELLDHIEHGRNIEAKSMLNRELAQAYDSDNQTLLHFAAQWGNDTIARELIGLGAEVDRAGFNGNSPLMFATLFEHATTAQILLQANANIGSTNNRGKSVLQIALDLDTIDTEFFHVFTCKLRTQTRNNEDLAERLIAAGCNMYHAATLRDVDLMERMLSRGIDIDSRGFRDRTALHASAELNDLHMAEWTINRGADMNACDVDGLSALTISTEHAHKDIVKFLLEQGADPMRHETDDNDTPLHAALYHLRYEATEYVECAELLLLHGASTEGTERLVDAFHSALDHSSDKGVEFLIAYLAMIEILRGTPIIKPVSEDEKYRSKLCKFENHVELCRTVLGSVVFGELSLLDLMHANEYKMRLLVRKETFSSVIEDFCCQHRLSEFCSYYYKALMKKIAEADHVVKLESVAISVICDLFESNYNQCYTFAKKVVAYLEVVDLQNLVEIETIEF